MWMTMIVAFVFFVAASVAALAFGYRQIELERSPEPAPAPQPGHCLLCNAPLRRQSTVQEVVYEVEHRINAELQDVIRLLGRTGPDGFDRLYRA